MVSVCLHDVSSFVFLNPQSLLAFYVGLHLAHRKQGLHLVVPADTPCLEASLNLIQLVVFSVADSNSSGMLPPCSLPFQSSFVPSPFSPFLLISTGLAWISDFA